MLSSTELIRPVELSPYPMGWGATLKGKRALNEDAFLIEREFGIYALADGIGGEEGGEVASHLVLEALSAFLRDHKAQLESGESELTLRLAVASAHDRLLDQAVGPLHRMGTTLAILKVQEDHVMVAHVGDSRIYRLRDGELALLTQDHSVKERYPARVGPMSPARALTQALARDINAFPDVSVFEREPGDLYLLCTDGVSEPLAHDRLTRLLKNTAPSLCAIRSVAQAIDAGGRDNATSVVVYDDETKESSLRLVKRPLESSAYETRRN